MYSSLRKLIAFAAISAIAVPVMAQARWVRLAETKTVRIDLDVNSLDYSLNQRTNEMHVTSIVRTQQSPASNGGVQWQYWIKPETCAAGSGPITYLDLGEKQPPRTVTWSKNGGTGNDVVGMAMCEFDKEVKRINNRKYKQV